MKLTPLMQQYVELKQKNPDALLFFRCGDFYELFFDDAKEAASRLGLALTARNRDRETGDGVPMAGVPHQSLETYVTKLLEQGCRVAIAEQLEDPKDAKGLVDRGIVEVVTPGTVTSQAMLDERRPTHILAIAPLRQRIGLAWLEVSTGRLAVEDIDRDALGDEVARIDPAEVLIPDADIGETLLAENPHLAHPHRYPAYAFDAKDGRRQLEEHLRVKTLVGFGCDDLGPALGAAGALLRYVGDVKPDHKAAIQRIERFHREETLLLDGATRRALEVLETARTRERKHSLLWAVDRTESAMGARLLRAWLAHPLRDRDGIAARHDAVAVLVRETSRREALREALHGMQDLERLAARVAAGRASPRDLAAVRATLQRLPSVATALEGAHAALLAAIAVHAVPLPGLLLRLERELCDEPPHTIGEGGVIRDGVSEDLDRWRALAREGRGFIASFQKREAERTGITSLKVGHNDVFGYYLEVTNTHRDKVPADYVRKQTLKNAERYVTPELREYEAQVSSARERSDRLELDLYAALRAAAEAEVDALMRAGAAIAEADVLAGLAALAVERSYVRPDMTEDRELVLVDARHPVLEQTIAEGAFVPNDVVLGGALDGEPRAHIAVVTGPNMAGKSTFCRQTALLVLLAQAGAFVPAREARIGIADRIFARIGSADEIASGLSTFMVEMTETANILNHATERSLVILDEVGRGTSTFDGVSLAFAITRHLSQQTGARTLFATHYHELCELAETDPHITNLTVAVKEWGDAIIFLHKIVLGSADRSYGLHVARLAGVPAPVLDHAAVVLARLEAQSLDGRGRSRLAEDGGPAAKPKGETAKQLDLFAPTGDQLAASLRSLDVANLTPLKALNWLADWQERVRAEP